MLFIFAAHYGEVENIIQALKMGKRKTSFPFLQYCTSEFRESEGRILLTICGEGRNNAAAAVSATLAKEGAKRGDILLSLGSAAILKAPHFTLSPKEKPDFSVRRMTCLFLMFAPIHLYFPRLIPMQ